MVVLAPFFVPTLAMDGSLTDQSQEVPPVLAAPKNLALSVARRPSARFSEVMVLLLPSTVCWMASPETVTLICAGSTAARSLPSGATGTAVMMASPGLTAITVARSPVPADTVATDGSLLTQWMGSAAAVGARTALTLTESFPLFLKV